MDKVMDYSIIISAAEPRFFSDSILFLILSVSVLVLVIFRIRFERLKRKVHNLSVAQRMQSKIFINEQGRIEELATLGDNEELEEYEEIDEDDELEDFEEEDDFDVEAQLEDVEISMPSVFDIDLSELIKKAKNGAPEFLLEFEEAFPDFITALRDIDPNIRGSELLFCAMSYLNLTTKEISNSTYVTVRAVQIRKNRLRKKLNIASEVDFNLWMRSLGRDE